LLLSNKSPFVGDCSLWNGIERNRNGFTLSLTQGVGATAANMAAVAYAPVSNEALLFRKRRLDNPNVLPRATGAAEVQRMKLNKWRGPARTFATGAR
jgi:hypothetical protein